MLPQLAARVGTNVGERRVATFRLSRGVVVVPSPRAGEGDAEVQQAPMGEGVAARPLTLSLPLQRRLPSPAGERASARTPSRVGKIVDARCPRGCAGADDFSHATPKVFQSPQPPVVFQNRVEQDLRAGGAFLEARRFRLVVRDAAEARHKDHGRRRYPGDIGSIVAGA
jgi:hypothetical protein